MPDRTRPCDATVRAARLAKAEEFFRVAQEAMTLASDETDVSNAATTLFVHAAIAASDVICCARLGEYAQGENHSQAVVLLARADPAAGRHLEVLLGLKTKAGYSHVGIGTLDLKRAGRAAEALLVRARGVP